MTECPLDAVLFNCDGVLVGSEHTANRALPEMLRECSRKKAGLPDESAKTYDN